jgi:hypothetical protein|tara:strand:- start:8891 stop:9307 length:417 start_codon:yes stop_codon:yes gene_type:complete
MKSLFLIALLLLFGACQSENYIIGKWRLVEIDFSDHLATLDSEERSFFEEIIEKQTTMLDQTFFNFEADSALQVITPKKDGTGQIMQIEKWGLSKNQDSLVMINTETELFFVNRSEKNKLILTSNDRPKRKLVLIKAD